MGICLVIWCLTLKLKAWARSPHQAKREGQHSRMFCFLEYMLFILAPHSYNSGCSHVTYLHLANQELPVFIWGFIRQSSTPAWKTCWCVHCRPLGTGTLLHRGNLNRAAGPPRMLLGSVYFSITHIISEHREKNSQEPLKYSQLLIS